MTTDSGVDLVVEDRLARLTLRNPSARNALSGPMMDDLEAAYARLRGQSDVRAVLVRGEGEHFCAGADINLLASIEGIADARRYLERWRRVYEGLARLPQPTVCAARGYVLGAGVELCLAADLVVAAEEATLALPEVRLGAVPGYAMIRLAASVGRARAMDLMATGRRLTGGEAERWGLVSRVVPDAELDEASEELARRLADGAPLAIGTIKRTLARADAEADWEAFVTGAAANLTSGDAGRGTRAFLDKERPAFEGD